MLMCICLTTVAAVLARFIWLLLHQRQCLSLWPSLTLSSEQSLWLSLPSHESPSLAHFVLIPYGSSRRDESLWLKLGYKLMEWRASGSLGYCFPTSVPWYNARNVKVGPIEQLTSRGLLWVLNGKCDSFRWRLNFKPYLLYWLYCPQQGQEFHKPFLFGRSCVGSIVLESY